eukprot:9196829-Pyramimonas_sp.AAC.2
MRLAYMLILPYEQVRTIFACNYFSRAQQVRQGILAGCTHATTMLMALPTRSIKLTTTVAKEARPRDLVDDVALSWTGLDPRGSRLVATACRVFCESARALGLNSAT